MGWDFHTDIHPLTGLAIMNLRFQGERIAYELHATEFSAVYSGGSNKKDLFYSDGEPFEPQPPPPPAALAASLVRHKATLARTWLLY